jgi:uncharacterized membrane protein
LEPVPFYRNPQMLVYGTGAISGGLMVARSFGFVLFKTEAHEVLFAGGVVGMGTCIYAIYRRIKRGKDPCDPSAPISTGL